VQLFTQLIGRDADTHHTPTRPSAANPLSEDVRLRNEAVVGLRHVVVELLDLVDHLLQLRAVAILKCLLERRREQDVSPELYRRAYNTTMHGNGSIHNAYSIRETVLAHHAMS